tara:strand:+ start:1099 stop:1236 length:138 start_codon:yes stop_codon:yes gene_type:complete
VGLVAKKQLVQVSNNANSLNWSYLLNLKTKAKQHNPCLPNRYYAA